MVIRKPKYQFIDYIFWILFIFRSNPGGILTKLVGDQAGAGIGISDFIFAIMFGCFIITFNSFEIKDTTFKKAIKYLFFFSIYYFLVFGYFVPELKDNTGYSLFQFLKKSKRPIFSLLLFVMIYRFYLRSYLLFFKALLISSILVLSLFFISFATGVELLPILRVNRGFININRIVLTGYGFMPLLIPLGIVIIVFKSHLKWKKIIIIGFIMMFIAWLLSLTRRQIIAPFILLIISFILYNYFQRKELIPVKKLFSILLFTIVLGFFISLVLPKYAEAGIASMEEIVNVIEDGQTSAGDGDVRLGFGKDFMQDLIKNNYWFGTGYHNKWGGSVGQKLGYETSDYPFLSAIAMTGILGLLCFLPIYILLIKKIIFDIKFLRNHRVNYQSPEVYFLIVFVVYFIYDLMQYMNWFSPVSQIKFAKWYIHFALYLASRNIFYSNYFKVKTSNKAK